MAKLLIANYTTLLMVIISISAIFTLTFLIIACICCRKPSQKDDYLGLDGKVKITNPDENVNHMTSSANSISTNEIGDTQAILNQDSVRESSIKSGRPSGNSNPNRSLPDIPVFAEPGNETTDTGSEIYATVEDKLAALPLTQYYATDEYNPTNNIANGTSSNKVRPSLSQQSSLSQADAPYARLKSEHPYDKLKKTEHPYASVQKTDPNSTSERQHDVINEITLTVEHSPNAQRTSTASLPMPSTSDGGGPSAPPRSRRGSTHSSQHEVATVDIPAATAVAGRVAASQELPYMTPPPLQQNFSGDSQDSSKGYTSISVREPLANIRAQTQTVNHVTRRQELSDPHYATVSDDSDEMYAAIEDPIQQVYTSGSETYAQIQPAVPVPETHHTVSETPSTTTTKAPAPQPPSVDSLRHVAQVHSRQASSSSCTSSVANLGSPKPEKRQANSPLPPRPPVSPELRPASVGRNLEDMYAKVQKGNKKKREPDESDRRSSALDYLNSNLRSNSVQNNNLDSALNTEPLHKLSFHVDGTSRMSWSSKESVEHSQQNRPDVDNDSTFSSDPELAVDVKLDIYAKSKVTEHCYETLSKNDRKSTSPKNKTFDNRQLLSVNSGPDSICNSDPGYEVVNRRSKSRPPSECDPNYEVLRPQNKVKRNSSECSNQSDVGYAHIGAKSDTTLNPLYSVVNKKNRNIDPGYERVKKQGDNVDEPNYESMASDCTEDPNYASITKKGGSETDSNYESVSHDDPNYEIVKYKKIIEEPPYERLHNSSTDSSSANIAGYEKVRKKSQSSILTDSSSICENSINKNTETSFSFSAQTDDTSQSDKSENNT